MNLKLKCLLMGGALAAAGKAHAYTCEVTTSLTTITVPALTVQKDLPVNAVIGSAESNAVSTFKCSGASGEFTYQEFGIKAYGTYLRDIDGKRVYESGIPGIGYAIGVSMPSASACSGAIGWVVPGHVIGGPDARLICAVNGIFGTQPMQGKAYLTFYKTAEVTGAGEIAGKKVGAFILRNNQSSWMYPESNINIGRLKVNTVSCSLRDAWIEVDMDKVGSHLFGGVGTWPGDNNTKPFSIPLSCAAGAKVNLKIDGNVQNASQGVLKLDAGKNSATGVGIQLLYDEKPVELGKTFKVGTASSKGEFNIPLKARYLQTEPTLTPGEANGSATITLTYQ